MIRHSNSNSTGRGDGLMDYTSVLTAPLYCGSSRHLVFSPPRLRGGSTVGICTLHSDSALSLSDCPGLGLEILALCGIGFVPGFAFCAARSMEVLEYVACSVSSLS